MEPEIRIYPNVTTPIPVFRGLVQDLHNFNIHATGAYEVGNSGFQIGEGEPISSGGNWGYTHRDFKPNTKGEILVYAGASVACDIVVTTWRN